MKEPSASVAYYKLDKFKYSISQNLTILRNYRKDIYTDLPKHLYHVMVPHKKKILWWKVITLKHSQTFDELYDFVYGYDGHVQKYHWV